MCRKKAKLKEKKEEGTTESEKGKRGQRFYLTEGRSEAKGRRGKEEGRRKEQKKDAMEKLCKDLQLPRKLEEILEDRICGCDFSPPFGNLPEF